MFQGDFRGIPQPRRYHVHGVFAYKLRLPGRSQGMEQSGPWHQAGPLHQPFKLGPKIAVPLTAGGAGRFAIAPNNHEFGVRDGWLPGFIQNCPQLREERDNSAFLAWVMHGPRRLNHHPVRLRLRSFNGAAVFQPRKGERGIVPDGLPRPSFNEAAVFQPRKVAALLPRNVAEGDRFNGAAVFQPRKGS